MQQVFQFWGIHRLFAATCALGLFLFAGSLSVRAEGPRVIALLFDDGPRPDTTPQLLDALRDTSMRATFSLIGEQVKAYPDLAKRIVAEGHEIANRTWSNRRLSELTLEEQQAEIAKCCAIIQETTGVKPRLLRVPFGEEYEWIDELANACGLDIVRHSFDSGDWRQPPKGIVSRAILEGVTPGSVVLIHEGFPAAVAEIPETIRELSRRGFVSRTFSEVQAGTPGARIFAGQ